MNPQFTIHKDLTTMFGFMTLVVLFFVMFMLVSLSIFNSNFKGFVYLAGASLLYVLVRLLNDSNSQVGEAHPLYCNLFGSTLGFSVPSFNSALYVFTLTYLLIPMISYNMFNIPLVLVPFIFVCLGYNYSDDLRGLHNLQRCFIGDTPRWRLGCGVLSSIVSNR